MEGRAKARVVRAVVKMRKERRVTGELYGEKDRWTRDSLWIEDGER